MVKRSTLALALALAAVVLVSVPSARAGAVFEVRETPSTNNLDYIFTYGGTPADLSKFGNTSAQFPNGNIGSIQRSGGLGAGLFFKTSAIPTAIFTLERCSAVAPHIHPNAAEILYVLKGKIRIHQFRGEEDSALRSFDVPFGKAGYIQQGAYHTVENIAPGQTVMLQIFDHPQGGAVFASPALSALPRNLVNAAFTSDVFPATPAAIAGAIVKVRICNW